VIPPGAHELHRIPKQHWKRIRIPNMAKWASKVLKRRTKVAGVFSNEKSLLGLVGSIMMDLNEEWVTGRKYLAMEKE